MLLQVSPHYPHKRIASKASLLKALRLTENELDTVLNNTEDYYRPNALNVKGRMTYSVGKPLKRVHQLINRRLLNRVVEPYYIYCVKGKGCKTNAKAHLGAKVLINEDINKCFDSCTSQHVFDVWRYLFNFSDEIANILTALTTTENKLPQGAITSTNLANLILWRYEPQLVENFRSRGLIYSRYVDDITVSSSKILSNTDKTVIIKKIYGMLTLVGLKPNRGKHTISHEYQPMTVNNQVINSGEVTLPKKFINNTRAAIFQLGHITDKNEKQKKYKSVLGGINHIRQYHPNKADALNEMLMGNT
tara:strand:+ start:2750 stop:3664 length:915 start_codon:yes stop_codon:yes gene_type:complete